MEAKLRDKQLIERQKIFSRDPHNAAAALTAHYARNFAIGTHDDARSRGHEVLRVGLARFFKPNFTAKAHRM
jgi:hypothetical protein